MEQFQIAYANASDKAKVLKHIVEFLEKRGNTAEAERWVKKGLDEKVEVQYDSAAAKQSLEKVKRKREAEVASRQGEASGGTTAPTGSKKKDDDPKAKGTVVTTAQLHAAASKNLEIAKQQYEGKRLRVTGQAGPYNTTIQQDRGTIFVVLVLNTGGKLPVYCRFPPSAGARLSRLQLGQQITVLGNCYWSPGNIEILLLDCVLEVPGT